MRAVPTFADLRAAEARIRGYIHRTPVFTCSGLDELAQARLFFKCENFQKAGAFKYRGAHNAVAMLARSANPRVIATHSSGNHGAALALAARVHGLSATVVMPINASVVKRAAVTNYGGKIIPCEPTDASRAANLAAVLSTSDAVPVHPYDDPRVIAGQGTVAIEVIEALPDLDALVVPVGGGGLISGAAIAVTEMAPRIRVIGAEPRGADDAQRSLRTGERLGLINPVTVADGLRTALGELTFAIMQSRVDDIVCVTEDAILAAMRLMWERMKIIVEPSAAVPLAAVLEHPTMFARQRIGLIVSGGNVDLDALPWLVRSMQTEGRDRIGL